MASAVRRAKTVAVFALAALLILLYISASSRSDDGRHVRDFRTPSQRKYDSDGNNFNKIEKQPSADKVDPDLSKIGEENGGGKAGMGKDGVVKAPIIETIGKDTEIVPDPEEDKHMDNPPDPPADVAKDMENDDKKEKEKEEYDPTVELAEIFKKSPIIIFSKSYCPYSRKAKRILLRGYDITPEPYVVELDQDEHGAEMQAVLANWTGRKTVPNIIVAGTSIGGGDEIEELDKSGKLADKLREKAGKRITEITKKRLVTER